MSILFSGVKPTGQLHLGNYLGALKQWVELQNQHQCFFSIVDLHALTIEQTPVELRQHIMDIAVDLLALGIDPNQATLFIQSHVLEHAQLGWIINCLMPIGELNRMTQFKDKAGNSPTNVNAGLLTYPCLMAADILLYGAEVVPVGEDQLQHLELARLAVRKAKKRWGLDLIEPKPIITKLARIMSLANPAKKMSKDLGASSYIALRDEPEVIRKKVAKAVTDSDTKGQSAGAKNLMDLLEIFADKKVFKQFTEAATIGKLQYAELKQTLAGAISGYFQNYRAKVKELAAKPDYIKQVLADGAAKARPVAHKNLKDIQEKIGLI